jgi:hypothetical protein
VCQLPSDLIWCDVRQVDGLSTGLATANPRLWPILNPSLNCAQDADVTGMRHAMVRDVSGGRSVDGAGECGCGGQNAEGAGALLA